MHPRFLLTSQNKGHPVFDSRACERTHVANDFRARNIPRQVDGTGLVVNHTITAFVVVNLFFILSSPIHSRPNS